MTGPQRALPPPPPPRSPPPHATPAHSTSAEAAARVLVCDDSAVIRSAISRMLESDPQISVVARVANGQLAVDAIARSSVDVVVLDIEMPVMDGLTALPLLLRADPTLRVIMASTLTTRGADIALRALRLGAADYLPKPGASAINDDSFRRDLLAKVRGLARLRRSAAARPSAVLAPGAPISGAPISGAPVSGSSASGSLPAQLRPAAANAPALLAIGSSTGGPQALFTLVQGLGTQLPVPAVLTQHMPATFMPILAEHLSRLGGAPCREAKDGEMLQPGHLYLAPGDRHLLIDASAGGLRARLDDGPPENFCRPAVDPMLRSAASACNGRVLVVMLTGMGHDGLAGTRQIVASGGAALAQDEATSVVWGMPGAIAQAGLCHNILPLAAIAPKVLDLLRGRRA